jgi:hypothetical protein
MPRKPRRRHRPRHRHPERSPARSSPENERIVDPESATTAADLAEPPAAPTDAPKDDITAAKAGVPSTGPDFDIDEPAPTDSTAADLEPDESEAFLPLSETSSSAEPLDILRSESLIDESVEPLASSIDDELVDESLDPQMQIADGAGVGSLTGAQDVSPAAPDSMDQMTAALQTTIPDLLRQIVKNTGNPPTSVIGP